MLVFAIKTPAGYSLHRDGYWISEGATPDQHYEAAKQLRSVFKKCNIVDMDNYLLVVGVELIEGKNTPFTGTIRKTKKGFVVTK